MGRPAGNTTGRGGTSGGRRGGRPFRGHRRLLKNAGDKGRFPRRQIRCPGNAAPGARVDSASGTSGAAQPGTAGDSEAAQTNGGGVDLPGGMGGPARLCVEGALGTPASSGPGAVSHTPSAATASANTTRPPGAPTYRSERAPSAKHTPPRSLHPKSAEDVGNAPTAASASELPDAALAALCRQRMSADPGFTAVVSQTGRAARVADDEFAPRQPNQHDQLLSAPVGRAARVDCDETGLQRPMSPQRPGQPGEFFGELANFH